MLGRQFRGNLSQILPSQKKKLWSLLRKQNVPLQRIHELIEICARGFPLMPTALKNIFLSELKESSRPSSSTLWHFQSESCIRRASDVYRLIDVWPSPFHVPAHPSWSGFLALVDTYDTLKRCIVPEGRIFTGFRGTYQILLLSCCHRSCDFFDRFLRT